MFLSSLLENILNEPIEIKALAYKKNSFVEIWREKKLFLFISIHPSIQSAIPMDDQKQRMTLSFRWSCQKKECILFHILLFLCDIKFYFP